MSLNKSLLPELEQEGASTRKMLAAVPLSNTQWKPHEKSMTIESLSTHLAELPGWVSLTLSTDELDFAKEGYKPTKVNTTEELLKLYDDNQKKAIEDLGKASDSALMENWSLRNGDAIYFTMPKIAVIRSFVMNHIVHHRAQLSVYLRLNNVPVPGMYGPTADEMM